MRLVDLSHVVEHGMTTYPGLPGPVINEYLRFEGSAEHYAPGTEFAIGRITMVANTGSYLDTPAHRFRDGHDLSGLAFERCAQLPAVVVDVSRTGTGSIGPDRFADHRALEGVAVLLRTGWDQHWGTSHYGDPSHPHLTEAAARALVDAGVALVGIDSVNIDNTTSGHRPAHTVLLAAGVPVVEGCLPRSRPFAFAAFMPSRVRRRARSASTMWTTPGLQVLQVVLSPRQGRWRSCGRSGEAHNAVSSRPTWRLSRAAIAQARLRCCASPRRGPELPKLTRSAR